MQKQSKVFFLLFFLFCTNGLFAQTKSTFFVIPDTLNVKRFNNSLIAGLGVYSSGSAWLWTQWYSQYELGAFRFHNDMGDWAHMDKLGHVYSAYTETTIAYDYIRWTGLSESKSLVTSALVGSGVQLTFEIMDGFSKDWGFSVPDVVFNTVGVGLFFGQQKLWKDQRMVLKSSNSFQQYPGTQIEGLDGTFTSLDIRGAELYGSGLGARYLKDYNTMNIWLSINPASFSKTNKLPPWLNVAFGLGAENLYGGSENSWPTQDPNFFLDDNIYPRYNQYYLSFDVDFTRIKTNSGFLRACFKVLNIFKVPSPTLEYNPITGFRFIPLYW